MALQRNDEWEAGSLYSDTQVEAILNECGVEIDDETHNDFLGFCPYHGNRHTPSFSVSKTKGQFICFNPACEEQGNLIDLVKYTRGFDEFKARRLILKYSRPEKISIAERRKAAVVSSELPEYTKIDVPARHAELMNTEYALKYMTEVRGFEKETLQYFEVGYSSKRDMITVPMHDSKGKLVGVIGRSADPESKEFKNSPKLPKSQTLWNIHRAKRSSAESLILVEASFDAMKVHQAGFSNVCAILGGSLSEHHIEQINKFFNGVIIMTDYDDRNKHIYKNCKKCFREGSNLCKGHNPGRELGRKIERLLRDKRVRWAAMGDGIVYPEGAKDAGDMTEDEIRTCIKNAVSPFEYNSWGLPD